MPTLPAMLTSQLRLIQINIQRIGDHMWRLASGLPTVRRSLITPDVFLGGQYQLRSIPRLKKQGVTGVINMRTHSIHSSEVAGLALLHLPTKDQHAPTQEQLWQGVRFANKQIAAGGKVYIHCRMGEGRGPTMAIAYLISTGLTYDDAYTHIKRIRTFINPTKAQVVALRTFEKQSRVTGK